MVAYLLQYIMLNAVMASLKQDKHQNTPPCGLKEIHINEEVKIAVSLSLERFHFSDQKGIRFFFSDFPKQLNNVFHMSEVLHCHYHYQSHCEERGVMVSEHNCLRNFAFLTDQKWNSPPPCPMLRGLSFIDWHNPLVTFLRAKGKFPHRI